MTPRRSITIAGAITAHIVSRIDAGDDQQDQPDADPEGGEDAGPEQRPEDRQDRAHQVADRGVAATVLDVLDQADDHPLVEGADREADDGPDPEQGEHVASSALRRSPTTRNSQKAIGSSTPAWSR